MKKKNEIMIEIKKSKFIAYYYEVENENEIKVILEQLKKEHKKARHMPYAYKLINTAKKTDDKEPSGTAGMPIYSILERKNMENSLIVVVRYFGGVKLGAGGLMRAYLEAANKVSELI